MAVGANVALLGLFGIPAAGLLGWAFGPQAGWGDRGDLDRLAIRVGALAVILGNLTVAVALFVASIVFDTPGWFGPVTGFVLTVVVGLLIFGLPAAAATLPASMAWIALLRRVIAWSDCPNRTLDERSR